MRDENPPPARRSTAAAVVCQSSDAAFHRLMSSGVVHARQTSSTGAATVVSTVIFMASLASFHFQVSTHSSNGDSRDRQAWRVFWTIVAMSARPSLDKEEAGNLCWSRGKASAGG